MRGRAALRNYDAVYIHGSGGFNDIWWATIFIFKQVADVFDCLIIVGPQSVRFNNINPASVFEGVSNRVHFFTREPYSYKILDDVLAGFDAMTLNLSPDTALYLSASDFGFEMTEGYVLCAFRQDAESAVTEAELPDVPDEEAHWDDIAVTKETANGYLGAITKASEVFSDRLHTAIGAEILGKPFTLYDNQYHKSRGVYEYSLSEIKNSEFRYLR